MVVCLEDIVGSKGGGSDEKQFEVVNEITGFIDVEISSDTEKISVKNIFSSNHHFSKAEDKWVA